MLNLEDPVVKELVQAKVNLLFNKAFFGNLASRLTLVDATGWCPTAATDGRKFYYNRDFIKKLSREEIVFLVGHEILHAVFDHLGRRGSRDPEIWNMAADYIVNYTLVKENVGKMIKGGLYSEKYTDIMTSEEVYNLLKKNAVKIEMPLDMHLDLEKTKKKEKGKGSQSQKGQGNSDGNGDSDGDGGQDPNGNSNGNGNQKVSVTVMGDEDGPPSLSEEELNEIRNEIKAAVINAAQAAGAGNVPAGVRRMIEELTEPKMDWRELLEMHIKSSMRDDYTFRRISRRSWGVSDLIGKRLVFPGQNDMDTIDVVCAIDTSGSMTERMLRDFLSEVKGIMEMFPDFTLRLLTFDTRVYDYKVFTPENIDEIHQYPMRGGGGTMFECAFDFLKEELDEAPMKLCVFTDGFPCGTWGDEEYCDTLFIIHGENGIEAPFGLTAHYDDKE